MGDLAVHVDHIDDQLDAAQDEAYPIGDPEEDVSIKHSVRCPDASVEEEEEGEEEGHELHALGGDHRFLFNFCFHNL